MNQTFADVLKAEMSARGLLVRELAAKLGVSTVCIQHWRCNRWNPKIPQALKLARLLGMTVEQLFGGCIDNNQQIGIMPKK